MKHEPKLDVNRLPKGNVPYSVDVNYELYEKYGLSGMNGNFEGSRELSTKEIEEVAELISSVNGRTRVYDQWLHPGTTDFWRLCLGYEKN